MSDWLRIDNKQFRDVTPSVKKVPGEGTKVRMMMSPHAMPIAVRGLSAGKDGNSLRIEFRYIDEEPVAKTVIKDNVTVEYGKNSQRILAIVLPPHMIDEGPIELKLSVERVTEDFEKKIRDSRPGKLLQDNLLSARSSVEQVGEQLLGHADA